MFRFLNKTRISDKIRTTVIMENLNLLSINQLNDQIKLTETWKALNNDKVNPINSLKITQKVGQRNSRSATNGNLVEPGTSCLAKQTFINDSARVWNRAPQSIRICSSLYSAKKEIKKFVKTLPV